MLKACSLLEVTEVHFQFYAWLSWLRVSALRGQCFGLLSLSVLNGGSLNSLPHVCVAVQNSLRNIRSMSCQIKEPVFLTWKSAGN